METAFQDAGLSDVLFREYFPPKCYLTLLHFPVLHYLLAVSLTMLTVPHCAMKDHVSNVGAFKASVAASVATAVGHAGFTPL